MCMLPDNPFLMFHGKSNHSQTLCVPYRHQLRLALVLGGLLAHREIFKMRGDMIKNFNRRNLYNVQGLPPIHTHL